MFNTILCATDFSEFSRQVIDCGIDLCRCFDAHLIIFHAVPSQTDPLYASGVAEGLRDRADRIESARQRIQELVGEHRIRWEPMIVHGDSVENLQPLVTRRSIDLVVAASYGLTGLKRMLMGTIVERMARSLACPLWVLSRTETRRAAAHCIPENGRILVGCDFSQESRNAFISAARMAPVFGAKIELVHAMESPLDEELSEFSEGPYEEAQQRLHDRVQDRLHEFFSTDPAMEVQTSVVHGVPGEQLPQLAQKRGAGLIVVGVRRQGPFEKYLRGSTTEAVLRRAPCSVLVVPGDDREGSS